MPTIINIHEAKTHLSRIVEDVASGREVIIAKAGRPVARLVPLEPRVEPKHFGLLRGAFVVPQEFDAALPDDTLETFARPP